MTVQRCSMCWSSAAGKPGLATAFALKLQQVANARTVDRNPRGLGGPWRRFARKQQLRDLHRGAR